MARLTCGEELRKRLEEWEELNGGTRLPSLENKDSRGGERFSARGIICETVRWCSSSNWADRIKALRHSLTHTITQSGWNRSPLSGHTSIEYLPDLLRSYCLATHIGAQSRQPRLRCDLSGRWALNSRLRVPDVRSDHCSSQRAPGWFRCGGTHGARRALRANFVVIRLAFTLAKPGGTHGMMVGGSLILADIYCNGAGVEREIPIPSAEDHPVNCRSSVY